VRWNNELFDMVNDANFEQYGLAWSVAVPEPGTIGLLLLAGLSLAALRFRKAATAL
jgi:hypothetical protein